MQVLHFFFISLLQWWWPVPVWICASRKQEEFDSVDQWSRDRGLWQSSFVRPLVRGVPEDHVCLWGLTWEKGTAGKVYRYGRYFFYSCFQQCLLCANTVVTKKANTKCQLCMPIFILNMLITATWNPSLRRFIVLFFLYNAPSQLNNKQFYRSEKTCRYTTFCTTKYIQQTKRYKTCVK